MNKNQSRSGSFRISICTEDFLTVLNTRMKGHPMNNLLLQLFILCFGDRSNRQTWNVPLSECLCVLWVCSVLEPHSIFRHAECTEVVKILNASLRDESQVIIMQRALYFVSWFINSLRGQLISNVRIFTKESTDGCSLALKGVIFLVSGSHCIWPPANLRIFWKFSKYATLYTNRRIIWLE